MGIPKIIHQIWIGSKPKPTKFMDTWKNKHKDFEYISWTEEEIEKRKIIFKCQHKIDEVEEFAGKTDIMRLEILYKYGGIYLDADSICVEKIDDELLNTKCFAAWEQEEVRKGLIANGTMGFPPKHPLVKACID
jgi:mannosyltransferase OCH1-like enzyme